jgi:hypothetical protein
MTDRETRYHLKQESKQDIETKSKRRSRTTAFLILTKTKIKLKQLSQIVFHDG